MEEVKITLQLVSARPYPATGSQIILSTDGLIDFLKDQKTEKVAILGTDAFKKTVLDDGFVIDEKNPEYLLMGYDTELTYKKLATATILIGRGVDLLATHCDLVCPTEEGPIPDIGSMIALIETATGVRPKRIFGKPNPEMILHVIRKKGITMEKVVVIGDRLYTDIELAKRIGCSSVLVLSGDTKREDVEESDVNPNLIVKRIAKISIG